MKKQYKREAYYLDDGILLHGYKDKRGFHPDNGLSCGFILQTLRKKAIGKTLFFSISKAISKLGEVELAGKKLVFSIDDGMAVTRICYTVGEISGFYTTETLMLGGNEKEVIDECLNSIGIKAVHETEIIYSISSEYINSKKLVTHKLMIK